jgi:hypothetical protein
MSENIQVETEKSVKTDENGNEVTTTYFYTTTTYDEPTSCKEIKKRDKSAPSGFYDIALNKRKKMQKVQVYCEMGLNGGGYTFLSPDDISVMTDSELQEIVTDRSNVLMRVRMANGNQPYAVLRQLDSYRRDPLKISLHNHAGYTRPANVATLGNEYLYLGFIPAKKARAKTFQGIKVNSRQLKFKNCDANPNSYIALFPNQKERNPTKYAFGGKWNMFRNLVASMRQNPSSRVMPEEYFMFLEMHQGGCGIYTQTDKRYSIGGIISAAIGFR